MMHTTRHQLVEAGYDRVADHYRASKRPIDLATMARLTILLDGLPPTARVLDLGCGAGLPVTGWLAERAIVIGVDRSARQLALARRQCPTAAFIRADLADVAFRPASVDAVVALYSIIHLARPLHATLVGRIRDWLRPGGAFLATWAINAWEGQEADWNGWGAPMWWSHYDAATNLALLTQAGLGIEAAEQQTAGDETWLWALARRLVP